MNFFKSILSDDPDPDPKSPTHHQNDAVENPDQQSTPLTGNRETNQSAGNSSGLWSFDGLIKTITTRSESVLETYRRDLQEFGSGLKKETELFREVASRAVKELPASSSAAAHGSLESVSHVLDGVLKSTVEMIAQGNQSLISDNESESVEPGQHSGRYSWFEAQLNSIQNDPNTFTEEPDDADEYKKFVLSFKLDEKKDEIDELIGENGVLGGVYEKIVPNVVDDETYWCRYFYRVDKLKQQESVRAKLVKRVISVDDEEELSWDFDDDEEEEAIVLKGKDKHLSEVGEKGDSKELKNVKEESGSNVENDDKIDVVELKNEKDEILKSDEKVEPEEKNDVKVNSEESVVVKNDEKTVKSDDVSVDKKDEKNDESGKVNDISVEKNDEKTVKSKKLSVDGKGEKSESGKENVKNDEKMVKKDNVGEDGKGEKKESDKGNDVAAVSNDKSAIDEDLEWDEIEDVGSDNEKKVTNTQGGSPNRAELRKRLSAAEEDEDLSWDIEDDD